MTFEEYQKEAQGTATYPGIGNNYVYPTLGLSGEAGEVADIIKKVIRDDDGEISEEKMRNLKKELGDVLWYISSLATELGLSLDDIAAGNIEKLLSRKERGVLGGSGDNR
jgi:NTP pyrophosphatase (non-canonical NTP hydrolase)